MAEQDAAAEATAAGNAPPTAVQLGAEIPPGSGAPPAPQLVEPEQAESASRDGLPEDGELTSKQANDALASMLSTQPPPLPTEIVEMKALAERMGIERFDVQIRGLNDSELEQISERATKEPTKAQRKMGMSRGAPDFTRQKRLIVATAMMVPNLKNPELLDKYGPRDEDVVQKWFLSGEIDQLSEAVNDMSGYGAGAVERAKE